MERFDNSMRLETTYLHCCKHCHRADGGVGQSLCRVLESQVDELQYLSLVLHCSGTTLPSMHNVKMSLSEVEGCAVEERICHSVGHPYGGQRVFTSTGFNWRKGARYHRIDYQR